MRFKRFPWVLVLFAGVVVREGFGGLVVGGEPLDDVDDKVGSEEMKIHICAPFGTSCGFVGKWIGLSGLLLESVYEPRIN